MLADVEALVLSMVAGVDVRAFLAAGRSDAAAGDESRFTLATPTRHRGTTAAGRELLESAVVGRAAESACSSSAVRDEDIERFGEGEGGRC